MIIGSHVDYKKDTGLLGSVNKTLDFGGNAFMFYIGAPQNTIRSLVNDELTYLGYTKMIENGIKVDNVIIHAPYIINMANADNFEFNVNFLSEEIKRVENLGLKKMVIHPGSHVGKGIEYGISYIIKVLNSVLPSSNIKILLETMSGKGSEIGSNFNELKQIINGVNQQEKVGICLDTCHLNDAGYDLKEFDKTLKEFDNKIGLNNIGCVHINDSKNEIGSHKDRHENIGYGTIGFNTMIDIIYNDLLKDVPKILETPYINDLPPYKEEIENIKFKKIKNILK